MSQTAIIASPTALDVHDLTTSALPDLSWLAVAAVVCAAATVALVVLTVVLSLPRRRTSGDRTPHGAHRESSPLAVWHERIDAIVAAERSGDISREEAFTRLAAVARDFASEASDAELGTSTLHEIGSRSHGGEVGKSGTHGFTLLRQTIAALYPPEFADGQFNRQARETTVKQAAAWVSNLVERWRR
ncbi:hypothetical protein [Bifidobacterium leontopitheci]|uniref:Uncharacterized protein n=1 Tax=Bifidobacterium leontopitheci TaxID=2650774 RepID=A0A6I1GY76_9BIFI|nr:hypothetical protein [Bifidobacterium leontopitheci]KAB7791411.1 hypothetical protein F7D09_0086 [Bifidobacterium leontopitheci]